MCHFFWGGQTKRRQIHRRYIFSVSKIIAWSSARALTEQVIWTLCKHSVSRVWWPANTVPSSRDEADAELVKKKQKKKPYIQENKYKHTSDNSSCSGLVCAEHCNVEVGSSETSALTLIQWIQTSCQSRVQAAHTELSRGGKQVTLYTVFDFIWRKRPADQSDKGSTDKRKMRQSTRTCSYCSIDQWGSAVPAGNAQALLQ